MESYHYIFDQEANTYVFQTQFGWIYTISMIQSAEYFIGNDLLYNNGSVFEISFSRHSEQGRKAAHFYDNRVMITIRKAIQHYLETHDLNNIYFFICYSADRKEAARMSLFIRWFESVENPNWDLFCYELYDPMFVIFYGLLVGKINSSPKPVADEFEKFIQTEKDLYKDLVRRR